MTRFWTILKDKINGKHDKKYKGLTQQLKKMIKSQKLMLNFKLDKLTDRKFWRKWKEKINFWVKLKLQEEHVITVEDSP